MDKDQTMALINSSAFAAINMLIDEKAVTLELLVMDFQQRVENVYKTSYPMPIQTRIHQEGKQQINLTCNLIDLQETSQRFATRVQQLQNEIRDLQGFKCQLMGDWDYIRDPDPHKQMLTKVFGSEKVPVAQRERATTS